MAPAPEGGTGEHEAAHNAEVGTPLTEPMAKWGAALDGGFQIVPDLLLRHQRELHLTNNDLVVLLHLTMAWWERGRAPYPRTSTIARRVDASERTVQRSIERLRKSRLLRKSTQTVNGEKRTAYDLTPLAERLQSIASTDFHALRRRELRAEEAEVHTSQPQTREAGAQTPPPAQAL